MNIARSTFYHKPAVINPDGMQAEADLMDRIEGTTPERQSAHKPQEGATSDAGERFALPGQAEMGKYD
jgi:hypothetical protein